MSHHRDTTATSPRNGRWREPLLVPALIWTGNALIFPVAFHSPVATAVAVTSAFWMWVCFWCFRRGA